MSTVTPAIRDLARRLIALEAARDTSPGAYPSAAVRVCHRLRAPLVRLAGVAGFRSLMSRALAIAKTEVPSLAVAQVCADGRLEGLEGLQPDEGVESGAGDTIVARLLDLLVTFIGEPLTLRLVRDVWPDETVTGADAGSGEQP
ncbi:hypothetical protein [Frigoriglobus tundricola]|nr:hypothetical protein [Frigoriglobus tundricola]